MDETLSAPSENKTPLYVAAGALLIAAGSLLWAYGINKKVNAKTDDVAAMKAYVDEKLAAQSSSDALIAIQADIAQLKAAQAEQEVMNGRTTEGLRQASEAYVKLYATVNSRGSANTRANTAQSRGPIGDATVSQVGANGEYKVVSGDNPSVIARKNGVSLADLMAANPGLNPSKLQVGQTIKIPAKK